MVRVIGHRGASATHPENTLGAFQAAADQGAQGIELDVRRTADDVLVVFHDAHLANGKVIRELGAAELPSFVPTLAEALEVCSDLWVNIEIKNLPEDPDYDTEHGLSIAVAGLVAAFGPAGAAIASKGVASQTRISCHRQGFDRLCERKPFSCACSGSSERSVGSLRRNSPSPVSAMLSCSTTKNSPASSELPPLVY